MEWPKYPINSRHSTKKKLKKSWKFEMHFNQLDWVKPFSVTEKKNQYFFFKFSRHLICIREFEIVSIVGKTKVINKKILNNFPFDVFHDSIYIYHKQSKGKLRPRELSKHSLKNQFLFVCDRFHIISGD